MSEHKDVKVVPVRGFKGGDPVAIGKMGGRPKGSKNRKPQLPNPLADLSPRKALYVRSRFKGMSKAESAIAAGYSPATAKSPTHIETADVKEAFRQLMAQAIPAEEIVETVRERFGGGGWTRTNDLRIMRPSL